MRRADQGIALLEVIVALAILAGAGTALVAAVGAALRSEAELYQREAALMAAGRVLAAMTLLTREDLDRRLGDRAVGELVVGVQRPEPALYRIGIRDGDALDVEMLVTVVYRPETQTR